MVRQQCVYFYVVGANVAVNNVKVFSVANEMQQWASFAKLSRCKIFRIAVNNVKSQNFIQREIKSRLKSGNACCHSAQNLLSSCLVSKHIKIKIYRNAVLLVVLSGCET